MGIYYEVCFQYWTLLRTRSKLLAYTFWWMRRLFHGKDSCTLEVFGYDFGRSHYLGQLEGPSYRYK